MVVPTYHSLPWPGRRLCASRSSSQQAMVLIVDNQLQQRDGPFVLAARFPDDVPGNLVAPGLRDEQLVVVDELQQVVFVDLRQRQQELDIRMLQRNLPPRRLHLFLERRPLLRPARHFEVEGEQKEQVLVVEFRRQLVVPPFEILEQPPGIQDFRPGDDRMVEHGQGLVPRHALPEFAGQFAEGGPPAGLDDVQERALSQGRS